MHIFQNSFRSERSIGPYHVSINSFSRKPVWPWVWFWLTRNKRTKVKRVFLESFPGSPPFILSPSLPSFSTSFLFPSSQPLQSYSLFQASLILMILLLQPCASPPVLELQVHTTMLRFQFIWGGAHNENLWWQEIQDSHFRACKLQTCVLGRLEIPRVFPMALLFPVHMGRTPRLQDDWGDSGPTGSQ